jgi:acetyl-CoA C-acetyltransferase
MNDVFIFEAVRTPRGKGKAGGSLYEMRPIDLLSQTLQGLRDRAIPDTAVVDDVMIGCVTQIHDQGGNLAKTALLMAGWATSVPGIVLNRYCSSSLDALMMASARIACGMDNLIVAGGVESMSRVPMNSEFAPHIYDPGVVSATAYIPQGVAADLIATLHGLVREDLDHYAASSQQKAATARKKEQFKNSILPLFDINGLPILSEDECIRPETDLTTLARLTPSFTDDAELGFDAIAQHQYPQVEQIRHIHTAGNSSAIADGAALIVAGNRQIGESLGLKPRARIRAFGVASSEPTIMLLGVIPAIEKALQKANLKPDDIQIWEINEAFAAIPLVTQRHFEIPDNRLNPSGGAIALGHPLGATGAILVGTAIDQLELLQQKTACIALCVGGGMGVALIIERV